MVSNHPAEGMHQRTTELGRAMTAGKYWRWSTFALLGMVALTPPGWLYLGSLPKQVPFPVHIDSCGGSVRVLPPTPDTYTLLQLAIQDKVGAFVKGLRGVSADQEVTKQNWRALEVQVTPKGAYKLAQTAETERPLLKREVVVVEQVRIFKRTERTYDVRWQEVTFGNSGAVRERKGTAAYSGLFTVEQRAPRTPEERELAPTGTFLDDWQFEKEH